VLLGTGSDGAREGKRNAIQKTIRISDPNEEEKLTHFNKVA